MTKPVKYGIVVGVLTMVWVLSIYFTHNQFSKIGLFSRIISYAFMIPALYMAMKEKRDQELNGYITLKECMKAGMALSMIVSLIVAAFTYVYFGWIDHEVLKFYQDLSSMSMKSQGRTPAEIEMAMTSLAEIFSPFRQATYVLMFTLLTGAIFSFICSTFVVRNPGEAA